MGGRYKRLNAYMLKHMGASGTLLLNKVLAKADILDVERATETQLLNLSEYIIESILSPVLTKGRLSIARSELIGILELDPGLFGLPLDLDGVRILPKDVKERTAEHFKNTSENLIKEIIQRCGVEEISNADSAKRICMVEYFVKEHFGSHGKAIIDKKIDELRLRDMNNAPQYNKLLLMEYIIQGMLCFYVRPLKARMLRSELVSILGADLELAQGPVTEHERASQHAKEVVKTEAAQKSNQRRKEFEDLMLFLVKRELSSRGIADARTAPPKLKDQVVSAVLAAMLGGMTKYVLSKIQTQDHLLKAKYGTRYLKKYLENVMLPYDAEKICVRLKSELAIH